MRTGSARGCHRLRTAGGSSCGRSVAYGCDCTQQQLSHVGGLLARAACPCGRCGHKQRPRATSPASRKPAACRPLAGCCPLLTTCSRASAAVGAMRTGSARGCHRLRTAGGSSCGRSVAYGCDCTQQQLSHVGGLLARAACPCGRCGHKQRPRATSPASRKPAACRPLAGC
ncbi:hypothetical protein C4D60_Mb02t02520 [Musa balbisiana]|uniref:Uncharacterized protein n=1 Tax=Musa balbisiana TaxID=52838 RepID=A0A4V4H2D8_MUSBA|nr:hypothetical protein C4D60_Mb02t02520 [Musa balbisiana]